MYVYRLLLIWLSAEYWNWNVDEVNGYYIYIYTHQLFVIWLSTEYWNWNVDEVNGQYIYVVVISYLI